MDSVAQSSPWNRSQEGTIAKRGSHRPAQLPWADAWQVYVSGNLLLLQAFQGPVTPGSPSLITIKEYPKLPVPCPYQSPHSPATTSQGKSNAVSFLHKLSQNLIQRPRDLPASPDPSLPASPSGPPFTSAIPYVLRLLQFLIGPVCPVLTAESPKQRACLSPRDTQCLHLVGEGKQKRGLGLLYTPQPPHAGPRQEWPEPTEPAVPGWRPRSPV